MWVLLGTGPQVAANYNLSKTRKLAHRKMEWELRVMGTTLGCSGSWSRMSAQREARLGAAITVNVCQWVASSTPRTASSSCASAGSSRTSSESVCLRVPMGEGASPRAHRTKRNEAMLFLRKQVFWWEEKWSEYFCGKFVGRYPYLIGFSLDKG